MKIKGIVSFIVLGMCSIFLLGCSLFKDLSYKSSCKRDECSIADVIKEIPYDIKGIASIEKKGSSWLIKTVNVSDDIAKQAISPTYKFVSAEYKFDSDTEQVEQIGVSKYSNEEFLPPSFTSLTGAVDTVENTAKSYNIFSIKFYNGSWVVDVSQCQSSKQSYDGVNSTTVQYTINPVNSVITKTENLD